MESCLLFLCNFGCVSGFLLVVVAIHVAEACVQSVVLSVLFAMHERLGVA